jgi:hypothetical protein
MNMASASFEKREYFRFDLANVVELMSGDAPPSDGFRGVTINISETGMCLFVFQPVSRNDRISIVKSMLPLCHWQGNVRWVNTLAPEFYKIGLQFDPAEGVSAAVMPTVHDLHGPAQRKRAAEDT